MSYSTGSLYVRLFRRAFNDWTSPDLQGIAGKKSYKPVGMLDQNVQVYLGSTGNCKMLYTFKWLSSSRALKLDQFVDV